jgi:hypothetical protein
MSTVMYPTLSWILRRSTTTRWAIVYKDREDCGREEVGEPMNV